MGMTDMQFKAFLRLAIRDLEDLMNAGTAQEKDKIAAKLLEDYKKSLED